MLIPSREVKFEGQQQTVDIEPCLGEEGGVCRGDFQFDRLICFLTVILEDSMQYVNFKKCLFFP